MKTIKINYREVIFILFSVICGISKFYPFNVELYFTYTLAVIWILYSYSVRCSKENIVTAKFHQKLFINPIICMFIYTFCMWIIKKPNGSGTVLDYYTRLLSNSLFLIITSLFICRAYVLFGRKTLELLWISMILSYSVLGILRAVVHCGVLTVFKSVFLLQDILEVNNYLEVHDLTFALGFFLLFYVVFGKMCGIRYLKFKIVISVLFIFMGYKRIELVSICMVILFYYIIEKYVKKTNNKYLILGLVGILLCMFFLSFIYNDRLVQIALKYNINFNYRLDTWAYWTGKTRFNIGFTGLGVGYVDKETYLLHGINGMINNGHVLLSGMHSDLLKKYIEIGFVPFLIWIYYILISKTQKLYKIEGFYTAEVYFLLIIYAIILYLTDNVYSYFLCNCSFILIPMSMKEYILNSNNRIKK